MRKRSLESLGQLWQPKEEGEKEVTSKREKPELGLTEY